MGYNELYAHIQTCHLAFNLLSQYRFFNSKFFHAFRKNDTKKKLLQKKSKVKIFCLVS